MCKEHIKAIKQIIKGRETLSILKRIEHSKGCLRATNLEVAIEIETPNIRDGIFKAEVLDMGFREELLDKDFTLDDFPGLPVIKAEQELELTGNDLEKIIRASEFSSKDQTRPVLTGVGIQGDKVYGCDGYRMYRNKLSNEITEHITLPSECVKVLKTLKAEKRNWVLTIGDEAAVFSSGSTRVYTRLIIGNLPDYESFLKANDYDTIFLLDLKTLNVSKDYIVVVDRENLNISVADESDRRNKIEISNGVSLEDATYPDRDEHNIIMALTGSDRNKFIEIDPKLLKVFGKHTIKCYAKRNGQIEVEVIK